MILLMTFDPMVKAVNDFLCANRQWLEQTGEIVKHIYVEVIQIEGEEDNLLTDLPESMYEIIRWNPDYDYVESQKDDLPFNRPDDALSFDSDFESVGKIKELLGKSRKVILISWINGLITSRYAYEVSVIASRMNIPVTYVGLLPFWGSMHSDAKYICHEIDQRKYKLRLVSIDKCWEDSKKEDKVERIRDAIENCEKKAVREIAQELEECFVIPGLGEP